MKNKMNKSQKDGKWTPPGRKVTIGDVT
ncbi:uncharacterized protein METZ01_LOCUS486553, partial [marine metagenome]